LKHSGTIKDYQTSKNCWLNLSISPQGQQVSCFTNGLKNTIEVDILAGRPTTLTQVIGLARLHEATNMSQ